MSEHDVVQSLRARRAPEKSHEDLEELLLKMDDKIMSLRASLEMSQAIGTIAKAALRQLMKDGESVTVNLAECDVDLDDIQYVKIIKVGNELDIQEVQSGS